MIIMDTSFSFTVIRILRETSPFTEIKSYGDQ